MSKYKVEMTQGQDQRYVDADGYYQEDGWLIFRRCPPTGGRAEYWRVRLEYVVAMETMA